MNNSWLLLSLWCESNPSKKMRRCHGAHDHGIRNPGARNLYSLSIWLERFLHQPHRHFATFNDPDALQSGAHCTDYKKSAFRYRHFVPWAGVESVFACDRDSSLYLFQVDTASLYSLYCPLVCEESVSELVDKTISSASSPSDLAFPGATFTRHTRPFKTAYLVGVRMSTARQTRFQTSGFN